LAIWKAKPTANCDSIVASARFDASSLPRVNSAIAVP
jgi:hypothetical protein